MAACRVCAQSRASHRPLTGLFHPLPVPNCSRSKVVVNFVTRLPPSKGNTVILTIMAYPSLSILSPYPSFRWLLRRRISLLFTCSGSIGIPVDIASDRGPQFASQVCLSHIRLPSPKAEEVAFPSIQAHLTHCKEAGKLTIPPRPAPHAAANSWWTHCVPLLSSTSPDWRFGSPPGMCLCRWISTQVRLKLPPYIPCFAAQACFHECPNYTSEVNVNIHWF